MFLASSGSLSCLLRRNSYSKAKVYVRAVRHVHDAKVDVKEVNFKVPWGHVSCRVWNGSDPSRKPVVCLHGWKDNAASWDRLIPMLVPEVPNYQFWAIDIIGHGKSSHIPGGMIYDLKLCVMMLKRMLHTQKWKNISIMGHSFGAQLGFLFSALHPHIVEKYIAIDGLTPMVWSRQDGIGMLSTWIQQLVDMEEKIANRKRPSYKYEAIVEKLLTTHVGGMDEESCKILMTRGIEETPKGSGLYAFTHDPRVHFMPLSYLSHRQISYLAKNFQSEVMFINAEEGVNVMSEYMGANIEKWLRKRNKRSVRFVDITGKHHCHLIAPETVYPYVFQILAK